MSKAIGNRYDQAINKSISNSERQASNILENTSSAHNKLLGFDQNYSKGNSAYEAWNSSLTSDQRKTIDEARSFVEKIAQENNINTQDALKIAVAANSGVGFNLLGTGGSLKLSAEGSRTYNDTAGYNKILQSSKDERFAESLAQIESFAYNSNYQQNSSINNNMIEGVRSDFNQAKQASFERSKAIDQTHSLQNSKTAFENNTSAISQDLSNKFAEENIQKFGASGFENKIRNKPEETNVLLNEFLNRNLNIKSAVSKDYNQPNDLSSDYQQNVQAIAKHNLDNKAKVSEAAPDNFQNEVKNTVDIKALKQNQVESQLNETSTKIILTSSDQSSKEANVREKVEAKHK